jgi:hypothetical protein
MFWPGVPWRVDRAACLSSWFASIWFSLEKVWKILIVTHDFFVPAAMQNF